MRPSLAVIGMALENRLRTIKLLGEQDPDEKMWPGHRSERQDHSRTIENRLGEPIGAANDE